MRDSKKVTVPVEEIVLDDITRHLRLDNPQLFRGSFARPNLRFVVRHGENKMEQMLRVIRGVAGSGIVYARTRKATEEIAINLTGNPLDIAFNARYFSDVLKALEDEALMLDMNNNISPCVVRPLQGDRFYYLVLPVRLFTGNM